MHDVINPILVYVKLSRSMCGESGLRSESRGDATLKLVYVHHPLDDTSLLKYLPASMDCRGVRELEEFLVAQRHVCDPFFHLHAFCVSTFSLPLLPA